MSYTTESTIYAAELLEMARERGETYESHGAGKAAATDIAIYIDEIADELIEDGYGLETAAAGKALMLLTAEAHVASRNPATYSADSIDHEVKRISQEKAATLGWWGAAEQAVELGRYKISLIRSHSGRAVAIEVTGPAGAYARALTRAVLDAVIDRPTWSLATAAGHVASGLVLVTIRHDARQ